jgi:hypothetical protein
VATILTDIFSAQCLPEPFDLVLKTKTTFQFVVFSKLAIFRYSFPNSALFWETLSVNVAVVAIFISSHFTYLIAISLRN